LEKGVTMRYHEVSSLCCIYKKVLLTPGLGI
jgi:hypothetical protein